MTSEMTSRERVLAAINLQEPDRVPVLPRGIQPWEHLWKDRVGRAEHLLQIGADARITLSLPWPYHPAVTWEQWREQEGRYTVLHRRFHTPAGALEAAARLTEDWQPEVLPLTGDHLWARQVEPLIKSEQDLEALGYLLYDPHQADLSEFFEQADYLKREAQRLGVLLEGGSSPAPHTTMCLLGPKQMFLTIRDNPELVRATLKRVQKWSRAATEILLARGVESIYYHGCYETVDFWSPADVRDFFHPLVQENINLTHQAGAKFHYFAETGIMPFLEDYTRMGVDVLSALDAAGTNAVDLAETKQLIGDRICLMGGVDPREAFERGSPEHVRQVVLETLRIMAPGGGYILSTTGSFQAAAKPENVAAFFKWGQVYGTYPLNLPSQ